MKTRKCRIVLELDLADGPDVTIHDVMLAADDIHRAALEEFMTCKDPKVRALEIVNVSWVN